MQRTLTILAALLAAQLLLAGGLALTGTGLGGHGASAVLVSIEKDKIDRLTVEGPDKKPPVTLVKAGDRWRLPDSGDFPADAGKVTQLLGRLGELKQGAPVATTAGARERFRVQDDAFERRITLGAGGRTVATLYLGTAQGPHRSFARAGDGSAIYEVDLSAYDAPFRPEDWEDLSVLQLPLAQVDAIDVAGLHLQRSTSAVPAAPAGTEGGEASQGAAGERRPWIVSGVAKGETLKPDSADRLASLIAQLRVGAVLGRDEQPAYGLKQPALALTLERSGGAKVDYAFGKPEPDGDYVLKVSTRPEYFRVPSYVAKPIIEAAARTALVGSAARAKGRPAAR